MEKVERRGAGVACRDGMEGWEEGGGVSVGVGEWDMEKVERRGAGVACRDGRKGEGKEGERKGQIECGY